MAADENMTPDPQPLEVRSEVVEQSIELTPDGRWLLVAVANNGFTWQVDATGPVQAAAVHHRDDEVATLKEENGRVKEWLQWYIEQYGPPGS